MRKALIVGIDHYADMPRLHGCVNDAHAVTSVLERHGDGSPNFDVVQLTASSTSDAISGAKLRDTVEKLFDDNHTETALFYFAGYGCVDSTGGYILASDARSGTDGVSLNDIVEFANRSRARNRIIMVESCQLGIADELHQRTESLELLLDVTLLATSTWESYADEENSTGIFTKIFVDGMNGAAANLVGDITLGGVYTHMDNSLSVWERRPFHGMQVSNFVSLRKVEPPINLASLRRIAELFPSEDFEFKLDPSFEPTSDTPAPENTDKFAVLRECARVNLVVPVGAPSMRLAALESKSCKLTLRRALPQAAGEEPDLRFGPGGERHTKRCPASARAPLAFVAAAGMPLVTRIRAVVPACSITPWMAR